MGLNQHLNYPSPGDLSIALLSNRSPSFHILLLTLQLYTTLPLQQLGNTWWHNVWVSYDKMSFVWLWRGMKKIIDDLTSWKAFSFEFMGFPSFAAPGFLITSLGAGLSKPLFGTVKIELVSEHQKLSAFLRSNFFLLKKSEFDIIIEPILNRQTWCFIWDCYSKNPSNRILAGAKIQTGHTAPCWNTNSRKNKKIFFTTVR